MLNSNLHFSCNHLNYNLVTSREFEQQRELREKGLQSGADGHGDGASVRIPSSEGVTNDQAYKVLIYARFLSVWIFPLDRLEQKNLLSSILFPSSHFVPFMSYIRLIF